MDGVAKSAYSSTVILLSLQCLYGSAFRNGISKCDMFPVMPRTIQQENEALVIIDFQQLSFPEVTGDPSTWTDSDQNASSTSNTTVRKDISCLCHIEIDNKINVSVLDVWPHSLEFQNNATNVTVINNFQEKKNATLWNASVWLSVVTTEAQHALLLAVLLKIEGGFSNASCTGNTVTPVIGLPGPSNKVPDKDTALKANTELLFETPLLLIAAGLGVIGILLAMATIAIWRRYRQERKKRRKENMARETVEFPQSNYEEISDCDDGHFTSISKTETDHSATLKTQNRYRELPSSGRRSSEAAHSIQSEKKATSPVSEQKQGSSSASRRIRKEQKSKKIGNKIDADNEAMGNHSSMQQEFDSCSKDFTRSPNRNDTRRPTPFLLALNSGGTQTPLRNTKSLSLDEPKVKSTPRTEHPDGNSFYCKLNRTGKLQPHQLNIATIYGDANVYDSSESTSDDKTTEGVGDIINLSQFPKLKSYQQKGAAQPETKNHDEKTCVSSNPDDHDHIYEDVGKEEDATKGNEHSVPLKLAKDSLELPILQDETAQSTQLTVEEPRVELEKTGESSQPRTTVLENDNKQDNQDIVLTTHKDILENKQDTRSAAILETVAVKNPQYVNMFLQTSPMEDNEETDGAMITGTGSFDKSSNSTRVMSVENPSRYETNNVHPTPSDSDNGTMPICVHSDMRGNNEETNTDIGENDEETDSVTRESGEDLEYVTRENDEDTDSDTKENYKDTDCVTKENDKNTHSVAIENDKDTFCVTRENDKNTFCVTRGNDKNADSEAIENWDTDSDTREMNDELDDELDSEECVMVDNIVYESTKLL